MISSASYIADVMRSRISSGRGFSENPTLDELAREFNVSFSPVRTAVEQLLREGWFIKADNRRLAVNRERIGRGDFEKEIRPPGNSDMAVSITQDLVVASLGGQPVYVREEETAAKYGVGRTVVRRVFSELAGKKLLKHLPYRGWELRPFLEDDLDAFTEMRELVETRALFLSRDRLDPGVLKKILDGNCVPPDGSRPKVDDSLHSYFVSSSKNRYFQDFFEGHIPYFLMFFSWESLTEEILSSVVEQHRNILEPLIAGKFGDARRALSRHIRYSHPVLRDAIASMRSRVPEQS